MKIKDLLSKYALSIPKTFSGEMLKVSEMHVDDFKINELYQRHISPAYIRKGGPLNLTLLTPIVVCLRPDHLGEDSGYYVVDGQHRCWRVIHSDYTGKVPVQIYEHKQDATLEDCVRIEAALFLVLNTNQKKTSKIDEIRAGIYCDDPEALHTLDMMEMLHLVCDNFGSSHDDAREVSVFTHFYLMATKDYPKQSAKILAGYHLLNQLYPNETVVKGDALRAMCLLSEFMQALSNGKQQRFSDFIYNVLPRVKTTKSLTKGRATSQSPTFILNDIIQMYNESQETEHYRIGEKLMDKLSNKNVGGNPRFALPKGDS